jgi:hypothetical protein
LLLGAGISQLLGISDFDLLTGSTMAYAQDAVAAPNHFKSLGSSKTRHWGLFRAIEQDLLVLNDYEPATKDFPTEYRDGRFSLIENEFDFSQPRSLPGATHWIPRKKLLTWSLGRTQWKE